MFTKKRLACAVGALTGSLAAMSAMHAAAQESDDAQAADAQDAQAATVEEPIEEMVVTGSRIRRAVSDTPNPITVFDRAEIELTGLENVADVLRSTTYNSFGSYREMSGYSAGQVATLSLRGMGDARTAVLINGRRVPGNPFMGTAAVDINTIPLAAVDRIEMLTDSASAIYGTDALGGVVNVVLRKGYEGAEFKVGTERPVREGADSDHFNILFGSAGERANIMFTGEWFQRKAIFDVDRDYSRVKVTDPGGGTGPRLGVDTIGVSLYGNTAYSPGWKRAIAVGDCSTEIYTGIFQKPYGGPGTACGYGYANISAQTGSLDRASTFLAVDYELLPDHKLFFESRLTRIASFGRYAPAPGYFSIPGDNPYNPFDTTAEWYDKDDEGNPKDFLLYHRFVAHGPRDANAVRYEMDNVLGINGPVGQSNINYEAYVRYFQYEATEKNETYILRTQAEQEVKLGNYNFVNPFSQDPKHLAAVARMAATLSRDILTDYTAAGAHVDGFAFDLPAGQIGWAAGVETASESYMDDYDSYRNAGNVLGSAGNSSAGSRSRWAAFAEASVPLLEELELHVAGRYDSYDDFGTAFSPQVAVRYQPLDMLVLRASWGEGFKAPNLTDLYKERSQSFNNVADTLRCAALNTDPCPSRQVENFAGGNPRLLAETSESFNVGFVVAPLEGLSVSLDHYKISIEDLVTSLNLATVLVLEKLQSLPSGVVVRRGTPTQPRDPGRLVSVDTIFANLAAREVTGFDLRVHYEFDLQWRGAYWGRATLDLEATKLDEFKSKATPVADWYDWLDNNGSPDRRVNLTANWSRNAYTLNYIWRFVGPHGTYDSWHTSDLIGVYSAPWKGEITLGVRNIADKDPALSARGWAGTTDAYYSRALYDLTGRVPFISFRYTF